MPATARHAANLLLLARALRLDLTPHVADEAVTALREALAAGEEPRFRAEAYAVLSDVLRRRALTAARSLGVDANILRLGLGVRVADLGDEGGRQAVRESR